MKKYHVTIMSIDPDLSEEDQHQKYGYTVDADSEEEAKEKGIEKLGDLPVFWIKCFEIT